MLKSLLFVAMGGCLGAVSRWGIASWIDQPRAGNPGILWGIFAANIIGCCLFGLLWGIGERSNWMTDALRLAIFTGFLGSFTTFSTFSFNTLELMKNGQTSVAFLNIALSVVAGIFGVWLGYFLATSLVR